MMPRLSRIPLLLWHYAVSLFLLGVTYAFSKTVVLKDAALGAPFHVFTAGILFVFCAIWRVCLALVALRTPSDVFRMILLRRAFPFHFDLHTLPGHLILLVSG